METATTMAVELIFILLFSPSLLHYHPCSIETRIIPRLATAADSRKTYLSVEILYYELSMSSHMNDPEGSIH
jgi:hypothetical protein